jgi:hypothetical protein
VRAGRLRGLACPDQGEFRDFLPTQLRGRQGAPFEILLERFRRRNHLGRTRQLLRVQHLWRLRQGSREITGPDPGKPFRPSSEEDRAHRLRQLQAIFDGGISRAQQLSLGGAPPPRGTIWGSYRSTEGRSSGRQLLRGCLRSGRTV